MPLPQPLHIFRKDLTHLWPETAIAVALFIAFAASAPSRWAASPYLVGIQLLSILLKLLMPLSWLVLIARLIHDEPLVGDRQFWTSRPYHWATLLAAKLLYLLVFLYLPFFLMQVYLLKHAGLYPMLAIPALLHNLLLLTVVIVVPLTAIAAVTGTFARMLLSSVGGLLYVLALAAAFIVILWGRMVPSALYPFTIAIFIVLPVIALVYQYATRKTGRSRWMLALTPLVIFLLLLLTPAQALIRGAYPLTNSNAPTLGPVPAKFAAAGPRPGEIVAVRNVDFALPVSMTGGDEKNVYFVDGVAVSVNGTQQPYMSVPAGATIGGATPYTVLPFSLSKALFEQNKTTPANLHFSITTDHLVVADEQKWRATLLPFSVPGKGICSYPQDQPDQQPVCHFPLVVPENTFVSAPLRISCEDQPGQPPQQAVAGQRLSSESSSFDAPDFDPVITRPLSLQIGQQLPPGVRLKLCPGTHLSFVQAKEHVRFEVDEKEITLNNYAVRVQPREPTTAPPQ